MQTARTALLIIDNKRENWRQLPVSFSAERFSAKLNAPAGGWHRLELRPSGSRRILAEGGVEHVGAGEIFVVAGQSNSANQGESDANQQDLTRTLSGELYRKYLEQLIRESRRAIG